MHCIFWVTTRDCSWVPFCSQSPHSVFYLIFFGIFQVFAVLSPPQLPFLNFRHLLSHFLGSLLYSLMFITMNTFVFYFLIFCEGILRLRLFSYTVSPEIEKFPIHSSAQRVLNKLIGKRCGSIQYPKKSTFVASLTFLLLYWMIYWFHMYLAYGVCCSLSEWNGPGYVPNWFSYWWYRGEGGTVCLCLPLPWLFFFFLLSIPLL